MPRLKIPRSPSTSVRKAQSPAAPSLRFPLAAWISVAACLFASCISNNSSPGVFFSTEPPGARVYVDGVDSGFATPCAISLDKTREHEVTFLLDGYRVARRDLYPHSRWTAIPWRDGDIGLGIWRFPVFLTTRGLLQPFAENDNLVPSRLYVPLEVATQN